METPYNITLTDAPTAEERQTIESGLAAYNAQYVPGDNYRPLSIFVRDLDGNVVGGLLGETYWNWLHIGWLWLQPEIRRNGLGQQLVKMAEAEARSRGCIGVHLDTLSHQALDFYIKLGYGVLGQMDEFLPGCTKFFVKKLF